MQPFGNVLLFFYVWSSSTGIYGKKRADSVEPKRKWGNQKMEPKLRTFLEG